MKTITLGEQNKSIARVFALGSFDGLHIGHRRVISTAVKNAISIGAECAVLRFEPLPAEFFGATHTRIMSDGVFCSSLERLGVDSLIRVDFGSIRGLSPQEFIRDLLMRSFGAAYICCGYNYTFGMNAEGNSDSLSMFCARYGIKCEVIPAVTTMINDEPVSSTRIRRMIADGYIESANSLMVSPFTIEAVINSSEMLGGKIRVSYSLSPSLMSPKPGKYNSRIMLGGNAFIAITTINSDRSVISEGNFKAFVGDIVFTELHSLV